MSALLRYVALSSIARSPAQCVGLGEQLPPTASAAEAELEVFRAHGWVLREDGKYSITDEGKRQAARTG